MPVPGFEKSVFCKSRIYSTRMGTCLATHCEQASALSPHHKLYCDSYFTDDKETDHLTVNITIQIENKNPKYMSRNSKKPDTKPRIICHVEENCISEKRTWDLQKVVTRRCVKYEVQKYTASSGRKPNFFPPCYSTHRPINAKTSFPHALLHSTDLHTRYYYQHFKLQ